MPTAIPDLKLGLLMPVVQRITPFAGTWEDTAGIAQMRVVAQSAERAGYDYLALPEHVGVSEQIAPYSGTSIFAPLPTLGYLAAVTDRIRLATYMLVPALHHPITLLKEYGTLDVLSGGRLTLGVGIGSLPGELAMLGAPAAGRGAALDEFLRWIRASWGHEHPDGADGFHIVPNGQQRHLPIWVGGLHVNSLRRAWRHADGWAPQSVTPDPGAPMGFRGVEPEELTAMLERVRAEEPRGVGLGDLELSVTPNASLDPLGDPDGTMDVLARWAEIGVTHLTCRLLADSHDQYTDQLAALPRLLTATPAGAA